MTTQPIFGIDTCVHAERVASYSQLPSWEEIRHCPVCLRRWRIIEARAAGWTPLSHAHAIRQLEVIAARLAQGYAPAEQDEEQGFYAHLAECSTCEANFAAALAALLVPAEAVAVTPKATWQAIPEPKWQALSPAGSWRKSVEELTTNVKTHFFEWVGSATNFVEFTRAFLSGATRPELQPVPMNLRLRRGTQQHHGASEHQKRLLQESVGPVVITLTENQSDRTVTLQLQLRARPEAMPVTVRLLPGAMAGTDQTEQVVTFVLSAEQPEVRYQLDRSMYTTAQIEIDDL